MGGKGKTHRGTQKQRDGERKHNCRHLKKLAFKKIGFSSVCFIFLLLLFMMSMPPSSSWYLQGRINFAVLCRTLIGIRELLHAATHSIPLILNL